MQLRDQFVVQRAGDNYPFPFTGIGFDHPFCYLTKTAAIVKSSIFIIMRQGAGS
jgi:hypothetical protein